MKNILMQCKIVFEMKLPLYAGRLMNCMSNKRGELHLRPRRADQHGGFLAAIGRWLGFVLRMKVAPSRDERGDLPWRDTANFLAAVNITHDRDTLCRSDLFPRRLD